MNTSLKPKSRTILSLLAAGLLGSTVFATTMMLGNPLPVHAATTMTTIDPTKGFSQLVDAVMPAVASVEVEYQETAATVENSPQGAPDLEKMPPQLRQFFEQFQKFQGQQGEQQQRRCFLRMNILVAKRLLGCLVHCNAKDGKCLLREGPRQRTQT